MNSCLCVISVLPTRAAVGTGNLPRTLSGTQLWACPEECKALVWVHSSWWYLQSATLRREVTRLTGQRSEGKKKKRQSIPQAQCSVARRQIYRVHSIRLALCTTSERSENQGKAMWPWLSGHCCAMSTEVLCPGSKSPVSPAGIHKQQQADSACKAGKPQTLHRPSQ